MKNVLGTLLRVGGFALIFVALLLAAARLVGGAAQGMGVQGVLSLLAALVASLVALRWDGRRSLRELGLGRAGAPGACGGGFLLGVVIVVPIVVLAVLAGGLRYGPDRGTVVEYLATGAWTAAVLLGPAAAEELLFRGYPMRVLVERWGTVAALALTTLAFSLAHGANPGVGPLAFANIALAGLLMGMILLVTGSLWWAIGLHAGWNFATTFLADLPVSGLTVVDAPLVEVTQRGRTLVTGGDFGLEGGVAATAGLLVAIGLLAARARGGPAVGAKGGGGLPARAGTEP